MASKILNQLNQAVTYQGSLVFSPTDGNPFAAISLKVAQGQEARIQSIIGSLACTTLVDYDRVLNIFLFIQKDLMITPASFSPTNDYQKQEDQIFHFSAAKPFKIRIPFPLEPLVLEGGKSYAIVLTAVPDSGVPPGSGGILSLTAFGKLSVARESEGEMVL